MCKSIATRDLRDIGKTAMLYSMLASGSLLGSSLFVADRAAAQVPNESSTIGLLESIDVSVAHRSRYETLNGQFRAGRSGSDQLLAFRTSLKLEAQSESVGFVAELMDSRQALADSGTPIDSGMVNTFDVLQGYAAMRFDNALSLNGRSEIRLGRQTLDIGSRRLVARNNFRNTVNAFTGVHYTGDIKDGPSIAAFFVLPVTRLPSDARSLLDNEHELDEEHSEVRFWGLHSQWDDGLLGGKGEIYVFGLDEDDSASAPTRNRELYTPGLRLSRKSASAAWDFDLELALQFGTTRGSTEASDARDLDHLAYFGHLELGYTFASSWSPRITALYDYASGDDSSTDDDSNRFDTLFGARRFEHGPTGIYGAFARSNINSPGLRMSFKPASHFETMITHRAYWLASDTDAWTTSGVRDASGNSGSFVGQQLEARLRFDVCPGHMRLELGGAYLFAGEFIDNAPNATGEGDTAYGYLQLDVTF